MSEVFDTGNGVPANFPTGSVSITINGSKKPNSTPNANETLGMFLKRIAQFYGVRTFSAFSNGGKLDTGSTLLTQTPLAAHVTAIEIVAKDSRGI